MKRSRSIRLVLIGSLSAGTLGGCQRDAPPDAGAVVPGNVYTNNHTVPGLGYYHAPFRAWYPYPYNHFDPQAQRYFYGGTWGPTPHQSITNLSTPLPEVLAAATAAQTRTQASDVQRRGFGRSGYHHSVWS